MSRLKTYTTKKFRTIYILIYCSIEIDKDGELFWLTLTFNDTHNKLNKNNNIFYELSLRCMYVYSTHPSQYYKWKYNY